MRSHTLMLAVILAAVAAGCTNPTAARNSDQAKPSFSQAAPPPPTTETQTTASDSTGGGERGGSGGFGSGH
jgi:hypothetical protein